MVRFYLRTCTGYRTARKGSSNTPGLTAVVLDRLNAHRAIASFRSEGYTGIVSGRRLGVEGAKRAAKALARRLNAEDVA